MAHFSLETNYLMKKFKAIYGFSEDSCSTRSLGEYVSLSCMSVLWQAGGSTGLLMDLAANEKAVHSDFFNGKMCSYTSDLPWLTFSPQTLTFKLPEKPLRVLGKSCVQLFGCSCRHYTYHLSLNSKLFQA